MTLFAELGSEPIEGNTSDATIEKGIGIVELAASTVVDACTRFTDVHLGTKTVSACVDAMTFVGTELDAARQSDRQRGCSGP